VESASNNFLEAIREGPAAEVVTIEASQAPKEYLPPLAALFETNLAYRLGEAAA
jgi:hypothetical protein